MHSSICVEFASKPPIPRWLVFLVSFRWQVALANVSAMLLSSLDVLKTNCNGRERRQIIRVHIQLRGRMNVGWFF